MSSRKKAVSSARAAVNPISWMVAICSFRTDRNSSSLNAVVPRISRLELRAFCVSRRSITLRSRARSSGRLTSTALWPRRSDTLVTTISARKKTACRISMESDEVFHLTAKFSSNSKVTDKHPILVNFKSRGSLLTAGARIDRAKVDLQTVEDGIALGRLPFLENLPVKLLHQQHGSATSQDVAISSQLLTGRSGSEKRNYFLLRQGRLARENGLGGELVDIDVIAHGVIADHRSA